LKSAEAEVLSNALDDDCAILYMKVLALGAKNKNTRNLITGSKFLYKGAEEDGRAFATERVERCDSF
jgi:hypothetical protein